MSTFDPTLYGPEFLKLITSREPNSLGPGTPNRDMKAALQSASVSTLFQHTQITHHDMADACLSAVWLYHDFLDDSHTISQSIHSSTGSFWHGIMHRREPDYSNAGYWFRKVGSHPIFSSLCSEASNITQEHGVTPNNEFLAKQSSWDPFAFIHFCESNYRKNNDDETLCMKIQQREWQLLFDYSYQQAAGA